MSWRGPEFEGEFPSLGPLVASYIESFCVIPDGELAGSPFKLTDDQYRFLCFFYRLEPDAREDAPARAFTYRRGSLVRPQGWGKGPYSAAIVCAEADDLEGPVVFAGWDARGEPVARPWATPWIQITAISEDQAANVWRALLPTLELSERLSSRIPDTGETRINLPGGGRIEPTTASSKSRLGQRVTFVVQDETHSWLKSNGGHDLADTQRRNVAKMGGRVLETTNAWNPADDSVAQRTADFGGKDVYIDRATLAEGSFTNKRERRRILRAAYGDSYWVDLDRIDAECEELIARADVAQAERFFGNRIVTGADSYLDAERIEALGDPSLQLRLEDEITLGFDGGRFDDSTALVACRISDGLLVPLGIWSRPDGPEGVAWEVDGIAVDAAVARAFEDYRCLFFYCDPPYWQDSVASWAEEYGREIVREWWTNRDRAMIAALERFSTAVASGDLRHSGDEEFVAHCRNARKRHTRSGVTVRKEHPSSAKKIDALVAAVLAFEARGDAIAAGRDWQRRQRRRTRRTRGGYAD